MRNDRWFGAKIIYRKTLVILLFIKAFCYAEKGTAFMLLELLIKIYFGAE